jgi:uncharacterized protein YkwD
VLARPGVLLLGLALAAALLVVPASAQAATPAQDYARAAVKATNKVRVAKDRGALKVDACLRKAAVRQAEVMAGKSNIFHQLLGPLLDGCVLSVVGENVAMGFVTGHAAVKKGWLKSPGHRRNLLDKRFTRVGIAARQSDEGVWYVAQVLGRPTS